MPLENYLQKINWLQAIVQEDNRLTSLATELFPSTDTTTDHVNVDIFRTMVSDTPVTRPLFNCNTKNLQSPLGYMSTS
mgnify:FL=1